MLFVRLGLASVLVVSSAALPIRGCHSSSRLSVQHPRFSRRSTSDSSDLQKTLEFWAPDGVPGHIDLITTRLSNNNSLAGRPYDPYTTFQSIPTGSPSYKLAEMGYNRAIPTSSSSSNSDSSYLLNAKPFGWGTKFWMLKSRDVDCYAGSEFAASYNSSSQVGSGGGIEYPVTLRSPLTSGEYDGIFAYCATYDPNPQGSGMKLGAAPCGKISCAPLIPPQSTIPTDLSASHTNDFTLELKGSASSFPSASRNPDGTFAPTFFTTRPCNFLDPSCHVSQIFLYNALTGTVRPMYHTHGMDGANNTRIATGQPNLQSAVPLWASVDMVFRRGDMRTLQGWPDADPALVAADPAFDRQSVAQPAPGPDTSWPDSGTRNSTDANPSYTPNSVAAAGSSPTLTLVANAGAASSCALNSLPVGSLSYTPVWLTPPAATSGSDGPRQVEIADLGYLAPTPVSGNNFLD